MYYQHLKPLLLNIYYIFKYSRMTNTVAKLAELKYTSFGGPGVSFITTQGDRLAVLSVHMTGHWIIARTCHKYPKNIYDPIHVIHLVKIVVERWKRLVGYVVFFLLANLFLYIRLKITAPGNSLSEVR